MRCHPLAACSLALLSAACATTRAAETVRDLIDADNRGDLAAALACYADDAVWLPPEQDQVNGLLAIRDRYRAQFADYAMQLEVRIDDEQREGHRALVRGRTTGRLLPRRGGEPIAVRDDFSAVLRRDTRGWRLVQLSWRPAAD